MFSARIVSSEKPAIIPICSFSLCFMSSSSGCFQDFYLLLILGNFSMIQSVGSFIHISYAWGLLNFLYMWVHSFNPILKTLGHYYFKYISGPLSLFPFKDSGDLCMCPLTSFHKSLVFIFWSHFYLRVSFRRVSIATSLKSLFFSEMPNPAKSFRCNKTLRFHY